MTDTALAGLAYHLRNAIESVDRCTFAFGPLALRPAHPGRLS